MSTVRVRHGAPEKNDRLRLVVFFNTTIQYNKTKISFCHRFTRVPFGHIFQTVVLPHIGAEERPFCFLVIPLSYSFFTKNIQNHLTNDKKYDKIVNCIIIACIMRSFLLAKKSILANCTKTSVLLTFLLAGGEAVHSNLPFYIWRDRFSDLSRRNGSELCLPRSARGGTVGCFRRFSGLNPII